MTKVITVFGSTGIQGGSVVRHLASLNEYSIRAVTRNASSTPAQRLASLPSVTIVVADLTKKETLFPAVEGAEAVFAITNFYDSESQINPLSEVQQGCTLADVALDAGVEIFIWSGVPSALVRSGGKYKSNNLVENKNTISQYLKYRNVPHVNLNVGFYLDNWVATYLNGMVHGTLSRAANGVIELTQPMLKSEAKQGMIWVEKDLGRVVAAILANWRQQPGLLGSIVWAAFDHHCMSDVMAEIKRQTGSEVRLITPSTTGVPDLDELYGYENEWGVLTDIPLPDPLTVSLGVRFHTLAEWVKEAVVPALANL